MNIDRTTAAPTTTPYTDSAEWRRTTRALRRIALSIVGEQAQSDDVVQDTWTRALERGSVRPLAWLRRVTRNRAIDAVRGRRTHTTQPLDDNLVSEEPTADGVAARLEIQRIVLDAVDSLPEPYRSTICLRYFDDLVPTDIARRQDVPLKTVKTRLTRAHEQLRQRLAHTQRSTDAHWSSALLAFATGGQPAATSLAAAPLPILVAATMKKLAVLLISALVLLAGFQLLSQPDSLPGTPVHDGTANAEQASRTGDAEPNSTAERGDVETADERVAVEAIADSSASTLATGSLRVLVTADGQPVPGVHVVAVSTGRVNGPRFRRESGVDGIAFFPELPCVFYSLSVARSANWQLSAVSIVRDTTAEAEIALPDGVHVRGHVLDAQDRPVPGADIVITSGERRWTAGAVLARSDESGRFELEHVSPRQSLLAIAPGYRPSPVVDLEVVDKSVSPIAIDLVVASGGATLSGEVTDVHGAPISDAVVALEASGRQRYGRIDGSMPDPAPPRVARTDGEGRYELHALDPGTHTMRVRRVGWPQWTGSIALDEGATSKRDVVLRRGATIHGTVRDESGAPIPRAGVHAFAEPLSESYLQSGQIDYRAVFAHAATTTDAHGEFRLERVSPGTMFCYALEPKYVPSPAISDPGSAPKMPERKRFVRFARARFDLEPDGEVTWNPVVSEGRTIHGSLRFQNGTPITRVFVSATDTDADARDRRALHTRDGTFKFIQLPGESYDVRVQMSDVPDGHEEPAVYGVRPSDEPLEIVATFDPVVPGARSKVRIGFEDTARRAIGDVTVQLERVDARGGIGSRSGRERDGQWQFSLDTPGTYRAFAASGDRVIAVSESFEVTAGQDLDRGTFESDAGGTLVLHVRGSESHPPAGLRAFLRLDACGHREKVTLSTVAPIRMEGMQAGRGEISWLGDNVTQAKLPFEILGGEETHLEIDLVAAVPVKYRIQWNATDRPGSMSLRFIDLDSGTLADSYEVPDLTRYSSPIEWSAFLPIGRYAFEVTQANGRSHREEFRVESLDPGDAPRCHADLR